MIKCYRVKNFNTVSGIGPMKYCILLENGAEIFVDQKTYLHGVQITDLVSYYEKDGKLHIHKVFPEIKGNDMKYPEAKILKTKYKVFDIKDEEG